MPRLSDTIARLAAQRGAAPFAAAPNGADRLRDLADFGTNPGNLRARIYVPERLAVSPALVVVLHGCTQTAAGYDTGAGWSRLADEAGFALLFPEQTRANNPNGCFNWFSPEDTGRDRGEALSIRQMIAAAVLEHGIDPARIFITGLSAGGAMASVMLATYPEVFAGGAIIAGLPYGCASGVPQALERMRGAGNVDAVALGALVRRAADHRGEWPTVSVWHGSADATVHSSNADAVLAQWRSVHGVADAPSTVDSVDGVPRRVWRNAGGRVVIEDYRIAGMGHGTPIAPGGDAGCGVAGPFMLDVGVSSTRHIASSWGLLGEPTAYRPTTTGRPEPVVNERLVSVSPASPPPASPSPPPVRHDVGRVIDDALRAAGLMR